MQSKLIMVVFKVNNEIMCLLIGMPLAFNACFDVDSFTEDNDIGITSSCIN